MKSKMNIDQKRALLDSFGGKFFSVDFIKKDGSVRHARCKRFEHKAFTDGHASLAKENPAGHKPEMYTCCDIDKDDRWINVNLNNVKKIACGNSVWEFDE